MILTEFFLDQNIFNFEIIVPIYYTMTMFFKILLDYLIASKTLYNRPIILGKQSYMTKITFNFKLYTLMIF